MTSPVNSTTSAAPPCGACAATMTPTGARSAGASGASSSVMAMPGNPELRYGARLRIEQIGQPIEIVRPCDNGDVGRERAFAPHDPDRHTLVSVAREQPHRERQHVVDRLPVDADEHVA